VPTLLRRLVFLALCLAVAAGLLALLFATLAPGGWSGPEIVIALCYLGALPWLAISAANGLIGLAILLGARDPAAFVTPPIAAAKQGLPQARTAIAVCVRNEDMAAVLPPLLTLGEGLARAGAGERFVLWVLSDTQDATLAAREEAAVAAARGAIPLRYRRRAENSNFKAGNVMEFCDHHAGDCAHLICLDADSEMSAWAVLRLVAAMEADPKLAILQQLIVGRPATAAFPRIFQFGMRAAMRAWATGQGWWQQQEGPYWGHNAIIRISAFRAHARLERLPDGSAILSHDQVEAVRLHAAGWRVYCWPEERGSREGNPPAMPEFLKRDARWLAGNMQYFQLLRLPNLTPMGRWQLVQAILLFAAAPLWTLLLLAAVLNVATGGAAATPAGALALLLLATSAAYVGAKLPGYAEVLLNGPRAASYGGRAAFAKGAAIELVFTQLFEPVRVLHQALVLVLRPKGGWAPQNRADRGVSWGDAARLLWPHTLFGVAVAAALLAVSGTAFLWSLPFSASLLLAIPFCVLTSSPAFSARLRARGLCAVPEEIAPGD
jgi:membrane glycosyltransferase